MIIKRIDNPAFELALTFAYNTAIVEKCRKLKGELGWQNFQWNPDLKAWCFNLNNLEEVVKTFTPVTVPDDVINELQKVKKLETAVNEAKTTAIKTSLPLFEYQKIGTNFAIAGNKVMINDDMGLGKSIQSIAAFHILKLKKVLIICPNSLKTNWQREITKWIGKPSHIINDSLYDGINIINYERLLKFSEQAGKKIKLSDDLLNFGWQMIIADECFPYETRVTTNKGLLKIGEIVENKLDISVLSYNTENKCIEWKKVVKHHKYNARPLIKITHEYGKIYCTANHNIYTSKGYKKAGLLKNGETLYILREDVFSGQKGEINSQILQSSLYSKMDKNSANPYGGNEREDKKSGREKKASISCKEKLYNVWQRVFRKFKKQASNREANLREFMCCEMENEFTGKKIITEQQNEGKSELLEREKKTRQLRTNDKTESRPCVQEKGNRCLLEMEKVESDLSASWRKWTTYETSNNLSELDEISDRIFNCDISSKGQVQEPPYLLQGRFSKRGKESSNRGGRILTQDEEMEILRQEKNGGLKLSGVVSVEILESGSLRESGRSIGEDKSIYDIEVEDNHNYFADNILVSNSHYIKEPKTKRTKLTLQLTKNCDRVLLLTGTPILNRPKELVSQLKAIDRLQDFAKDEWGFLFQFCSPKQNGFGWDFSGASNVDKLAKCMQKVSIRRLKEDVLPDLPDKLIHNTVLDLPEPKAYQKICDTVKKEIISLDEKYSLFYKSLKGLNETERAERMLEKMLDPEAQRKTAETLVLIEKLKQETARQKVIASEEMINEYIENKKKLIIFTVHKKIAYDLQKKYGKSVVVTGDIKLEDRMKAIDLFQNDPNILIFIATMKTAGVGYNLTAASEVIFMELGWTPAEMKQCEDRAWRIGQKNKVNINYLLMSETIDEDIVEILQNKSEVIEGAVEGKLLNSVVLNFLSKLK